MNNSNYLTILQIRESGNVQRMHTVPHHGEYTLATHQWNMAMLLMKLRPDYTHEEMEVVLTHDVAERWMGDIPHPAKRFMGPEMHQTIEDYERSIRESLFLVTERLLPPESLHWLKALDMLEFYMWLLDQAKLGAYLQFEQPTRVAQGVLAQDWVPSEVKDFIVYLDNHGNSRTNDFYNGENIDE